MKIFKIPFSPYDPLLFLYDGMTSYGFCILVFLCFDFFLGRAHEAIINNSKIWWKKMKKIIYSKGIIIFLSKNILLSTFNSYFISNYNFNQ